MKTIKSKSPGKAELKAFWQKRQAQAGESRFSGYLADESPEIIGKKRFIGEWRRVRRWMDDFNVGREACLDLGCGSGEWSLRFAHHFLKVQSLDWAESMATTTRRRASEAGLKNISARQGEVTSLRGHNRFDMIFVGGVLMYSTDEMLAPLMKSLHRLLKPDGLLVLRESTLKGETGFLRAGSLRQGLLATTENKADYSAIYRDARVYEQSLREAGLQLFMRRLNRHYKFTDICEAWLQRLNQWMGGRLQGNAAASDRWARRIFAFSWLTLWPIWIVGSLSGRWKLTNRWFLARKPV